MRVLWSSVRDSSGTIQYVAPIKPQITHTIKMFVWIIFVTSNGRMYSSGSGPRYLVADNRPNTS
ncbi:hypothetical protein D3C71_1892190 [compost metagenome]